MAKERAAVLVFCSSSCSASFARVTSCSRRSFASVIRPPRSEAKLGSALEKDGCAMILTPHGERTDSRRPTQSATIESDSDESALLRLAPYFQRWRLANRNRCHLLDSLRFWQP